MLIRQTCESNFSPNPTLSGVDNSALCEMLFNRVFNRKFSPISSAKLANISSYASLHLSLIKHYFQQRNFTELKYFISLLILYFGLTMS